jgi:pilus assembly protein CpaB
MLLKLALFMLMALGLAGFGAVAWISVQTPTVASSPAPVVTKTTILAAAHLVRAGNLLRPEDLIPLEVAVSDVSAGARPDTPAARAELFGAMVRRSLLANQQVLPADIMRPGDHGFLSAVLTPGTRAVTVAVDAVSGTAGLIWPGDHVDMILTQSLDGPDVGQAHRVSGETVLNDVRVIAIDQQLVQGASGAQEQTARTVTLEVKPSEAEKVSVAERLGHLSLTIRSLDPGLLTADTTPVRSMPSSGAPSPTAVTVPPLIAATNAPLTGAPGTPQDPQRAHGITWGADVSSALLDQHKSDAPKPSMRIFEGSTDQKDFPL